MLNLNKSDDVCGVFAFIIFNIKNFEFSVIYIHFSYFMIAIWCYFHSFRLR